MNSISQQGQRFIYDALVIGGGIAGLTYALELARLRPAMKIALVVKQGLVESSSYYAQGGIAAASLAEDSAALHISDTLNAGDGLCYLPTVEAIITASTQRLRDLKNHGVAFDRQHDGHPDLAQEGGHSCRRIYHAGDESGKAIVDVLMQAVKKTPQIQVLEFHTAVNLITDTESHIPGSWPEVIGAYVLDEQQALIHTLLASVVILATGGAGKVYRYTSNPDVATGDGIAMAYRAGARVGNMEFYQFHPTLLYHPQKNNFLISEALRGEGAYLRLAGSGERFMQRYEPERMELATRDIIAHAIFTEIERGAYPCVYLDIRHRGKAFLESRFPLIFQTLLTLGIDISRDLIPVVPAAHYLCGGVLADVNGKTDLPRLYALGETAFTGLHGANRLASNSLLECVVMGYAAAEDSTRWLGVAPNYEKAIDWDSYGVTDFRRASQINAHWRGLRGEMTSYAGIIRTEAGLKDLLKLIRARRGMIDEYYWQHIVTRDLVELRNIILIAELITRSAINRKESRGGHFRADYPEKLSNSKESIFQLNG